LSGRRLGCAALGILASGCWNLTDPAQPTENRLLVHAVLDLGADEQWVQVATTSAPDISVSGCTVTITMPDGTVLHGNEEALPSTSGGAYRFADLGSARRPLLPGRTYALEIKTAQGITVTGTTTVPDGTRLTTVEAFTSFSRSSDTVRMSWRPVTGAAAYEVVVHREHAVQGQSFFASYSTFTDTSVVLAGDARTFENNPIFETDGSATILVSAVDLNYYMYYHAVVDPFSGAPPSRLNGAVGVFGSTVPLRRRHYNQIVP